MHGDFDLKPTFDALYGKVVFLHITKGSKPNLQLSKAVTRLHGELSEFFDSRVHMLITNRSDLPARSETTSTSSPGEYRYSPLANSNHVHSPASQQFVSHLSPLDSPFASQLSPYASPSPSSLGRMCSSHSSVSSSTATLSRGQRMSLLTRSSITTEDVVEKALRRNLLVLTTKEFWKWFHDLPMEIQIFVEEIESKVIEEDKKLDVASGVRQLRVPCFKVLDLSFQERPMFVETTNFEPKMWPSEDFITDINENKSAVTKKGSNAAAPGKKGKDERKVAVVTQKRWKKKLAKIAEKQRKPARVNMCEGCHVSYRKLDHHLKSEAHQAYAEKADEHLKTVDDSIKKLPTFQQVIQIAQKRLSARQRLSSNAESSIDEQDGDLSFMLTKTGKRRSSGDGSQKSSTRRRRSSQVDRRTSTEAAEKEKSQAQPSASQQTRVDADNGISRRWAEVLAANSLEGSSDIVIINDGIPSAKLLQRRPEIDEDYEEQPASKTTIESLENGEAERTKIGKDAAPSEVKGIREKKVSRNSTHGEDDSEINKLKIEENESEGNTSKTANDEIELYSKIEEKSQENKNNEDRISKSEIVKEKKLLTNSEDEKSRNETSNGEVIKERRRSTRNGRNMSSTTEGKKENRSESVGDSVSSSKSDVKSERRLRRRLGSEDVETEGRLRGEKDDDEQISVKHSEHDNAASSTGTSKMKKKLKGVDKDDDSSQTEDKSKIGPEGDGISKGEDRNSDVEGETGEEGKGEKQCGQPVKSRENEDLISQSTAGQVTRERDENCEGRESRPKDDNNEAMTSTAFELETLKCNSEGFMGVVGMETKGSILCNEEMKKTVLHLLDESAGSTTSHVEDIQQLIDFQGIKLDIGVGHEVSCNGLNPGDTAETNEDHKESESHGTQEKTVPGKETSTLVCNVNEAVTQEDGSYKERMETKFLDEGPSEGVIIAPEVVANLQEVRSSDAYQEASQQDQNNDRSMKDSFEGLSALNISNDTNERSMEQTADTSNVQTKKKKRRKKEYVKCESPIRRQASLKAMENMRKSKPKEVKKVKDKTDTADGLMASTPVANRSQAEISSNIDDVFSQPEAVTTATSQESESDCMSQSSQPSTSQTGDSSVKQESLHFSPLSAASSSYRRLSTEVSGILQRLSFPVEPSPEPEARMQQNVNVSPVVGPPQMQPKPEPPSSPFITAAIPAPQPGTPTLLGSPFKGSSRKSLRGRIYATPSPRRRTTTRLFTRMGGTTRTSEELRRERSPEMECRFVNCPKCDAFHFKPQDIRPLSGEGQCKVEPTRSVDHVVIDALPMTLLSPKMESPRRSPPSLRGRIFTRKANRSTATTARPNVTPSPLRGNSAAENQSPQNLIEESPISETMKRNSATEHVARMTIRSKQKAVRVLRNRVKVESNRENVEVVAPSEMKVGSKIEPSSRLSVEANQENAAVEAPIRRKLRPRSISPEKNRKDVSIEKAAPPRKGLRNITNSADQAKKMILRNRENFHTNYNEDDDDEFYDWLNHSIEECTSREPVIALGRLDTDDEVTPSPVVNKRNTRRSKESNEWTPRSLEKARQSKESNQKASKSGEVTEKAVAARILRSRDNCPVSYNEHLMALEVKSSAKEARSSPEGSRRSRRRSLQKENIPLNFDDVNTEDDSDDEEAMDDLDESMEDKCAKRTPRVSLERLRGENEENETPNEALMKSPPAKRRIMTTIARSPILGSPGKYDYHVKTSSAKKPVKRLFTSSPLSRRNKK